VAALTSIQRINRYAPTPGGAVWVAHNSKDQNPFRDEKKRDWTLALRLKLFCFYLAANPELVALAKIELRGRDLAVPRRHLAIYRQQLERRRVVLSRC
jgi:hypothetical protein